jgi:hypothetical protein
MTEVLDANLDLLWEGYQGSARSAGDGLKRARRVLRKGSNDESAAVRDWLLALAVRVAAADRVMGDSAVSDAELRVIRDAAKWLDRPLPGLDQG